MRGFLIFIYLYLYTFICYNDQRDDEALEVQENVLGEQYFYIAIG